MADENKDNDELLKANWDRIAAEFDQLLELPPADRAAKLARLYEADASIAAEVESLIQSLSLDSDFLERPAAHLTTGDEIPANIGPYRILGRLGSGGMGTVYKGVRDDGNLEQVVAIKVVRAAGNRGHTLERFAHERRILSRLNHPGIARPLDAGAMDTDTAYLVMEYVNGVRIDRYSEEQGLSHAERLSLVAQVCDAVDHAHRNLVVHRDIKPANILVDESGNPRLLDFGISRLLDADSGLTQTGFLALTPEYASPEQVTGGAITTACDIYGLGALTYRLLTGRPPLDLSDLTLESMVQEIAHSEPSPLRQFDAALKGDVESIVLTALRKEPDRRYSSAGEMAADIRRHFAGVPVRAHPDSTAYRIGKFVRRHMLAVTMSSVFVTGLAASAVVATLQSQRAEQALERAEIENKRATQVLSFFQDMLTSANPARAQGESFTVNELLKHTAENLPAAELDPLALATVKETLGTTFLSLGDPASGVGLAQDASKLLIEALGPEHPRTLEARHAEARFYIYGGDYERAIEVLAPTYQARKRVLGDHVDTMSSLHNLAMSYAGLGQIEKALAMDLEQLAIMERTYGPDSSETLTTLISVGHGYYELDRLAEARTIFERVYEGQKIHLGEKHPTTLSALNNLATLTRAVGELERAELLYMEVVELRREVLGNLHAQTLNSLNNLGEHFLKLGDPESAAPYIEEARQGRLTALGAHHIDSIESLVAIAKLRRAQHRATEAAASLAEARTLADAHLDPNQGVHAKIDALEQQFSE